MFQVLGLIADVKDFGSCGSAHEGIQGCKVSMHPLGLKRGWGKTTREYFGRLVLSAIL